MEKESSAQTDSFVQGYPQGEHSFDFIFSFDSDFQQPSPPTFRPQSTRAPISFSTPKKLSSRPTYDPSENFLFTESLLVNPSPREAATPQPRKHPSNDQDLFHPEIYPHNRNGSDRTSVPPTNLQGDRYQIPQRDPGPGVPLGQEARGGALSLDFSKDLFGSPPSHLLESPGETPAQFQAAQLRIDSSVLSDSEVSVFSDTQLSLKGDSTNGTKCEAAGDKSRGPVTSSARSLSFQGISEAKAASTATEDLREKGEKLTLGGQRKKNRSNRAMENLKEAYSGDYDMLSMDGNMAVHPDIDELPSMSSANHAAPPPPDVVASPSSTEEALALQRAVIGNSTAAPASMDEINATIAEVQRQYRERLDKLGSERSSLLEEEEVDMSISESKKALYSSMSSLDETPTKLPASSHDSSQDDPTETIAPYDTPPKQPPPPMTISKKPSTLMAQNTTLAVQNAVSGKFNKTPTAGPGVGSPGGVVHGRVLHRNPIEGVMTHRGGRTVVAPKEDMIDRTEGQSTDHLQRNHRGSGDPPSQLQSLPNGIPPASTKPNHVPDDMDKTESEVPLGSAPAVLPSKKHGDARTLHENTHPPIHTTETDASSQTPQAKLLPPLFPVRRKDINKMPSTSISSKPTVNGDSDVMQLLREKANLEGQIEMLMAETETALQSRAELQAQVAGLQAQMRAQKGSLEQATHEKSTSEHYMQKLRADRTQLEDKVLSLQNALEAKESSLEDLRKELEGTKETGSKTEERLKESKRDTETKEMQMAKLREKVAQLENKLENSIDSGSQSSADVRSLQADLVSAQKTKDWFQDQLHLAQDDRNRLQREVSGMQERARADALSIELLRTENSQVRQQLGETRQQALLEKEQIAKHLETIEADILAREAAFAEIQREKLAVHDAVLAQMNEVEMEKHRVANLVASAVELERQLEATQKELAEKKNKLFEADAEKKELVKDLTLAQESLSNKERELESAEIKNKDIEARLSEKRSRAENQDDELARLRGDKTALEAALIAANEEKRSFDEALQKLRGDMEKVEKNYRNMAEEVAARDARLEEVAREKSASEEQLRGVAEQLRMEQENAGGYAATLGSKDTKLKELEQAKERLEADLQQATRDLEEADRTAAAAQATQQTLDDNLRQTAHALQVREQQLQEALSQNANLQGELETMKEDRGNYAVLLDENEALKEKLSDAQNQAHREAGEASAKVLKLGSDLNALRKELKEREQAHQDQIGNLNKSLSEVETAKAMAEETLQTAKSEAADMSKEEQRRMSEALMRTSNELDQIRKDKEGLETSLGEATRARDRETRDYQSRIAELENEIERLQEVLGEMKANQGDNRKLAIELERERGRLAGVHQSHAALKQHAGLLEAALARRESTMTELNEQLTATSQEKATEEDKLHQLVKELETGLAKEKVMSKDLRKQLASEKGKNRRTKETLQNKDTEIQELQGGLEKKAKELENSALTVANLQQSEEALKEQVEMGRKEIDGARAQIELLQRYLQDSIAQNPVLEDQMKTLAWECEQKTKEVDGVKEQMELSNKRQELEMDGLKNSLKMNKQELEALKKELAGTRKDKFAFQAKVGQLKAALKATVQQNQLLKAKLRAKKAQLQNSTSTPVDEIVVPEMAYDVEALLASDDIGNLSSGESKPLQALHGCLQSIRSQMGDLEKQLGEHQAAVNSSQEAWREVGDRVRDLRKACASSVPPRQPTTLDPEEPVDQGARPSEAPNQTPNLPGVYDI